MPSSRRGCSGRRRCTRSGPERIRAHRRTRARSSRDRSSDVQYLGAELRVRVALDIGGRLVAAVPSRPSVSTVGDRVGLAWPPDAVRPRRRHRRRRRRASDGRRRAGVRRRARPRAGADRRDPMTDEQQRGKHMRTSRIVDARRSPRWRSSPRRAATTTTTTAPRAGGHGASGDRGAGHDGTGGPRRRRARTTTGWHRSDAGGGERPEGALTELGEGEGEVNLIAWAGYVEDGSTDPAVDWVTPFEEATGARSTSSSATRPTRWCS